MDRELLFCFCLWVLSLKFSFSFVLVLVRSCSFSFYAYQYHTALAPRAPAAPVWLGVSASPPVTTPPRNFSPPLFRGFAPPPELPATPVVLPRALPYSESLAAWLSDDDMTVVDLTGEPDTGGITDDAPTIAADASPGDTDPPPQTSNSAWGSPDWSNSPSSVMG